MVGADDDCAHVQALVVEIGGTTRRPDGSTYHATWSLAGVAKRWRATTWTAPPQRNHGWPPYFRS
jgi:hypothetical protein